MRSALVFDNPPTDFLLVRPFLLQQSPFKESVHRSGFYPANVVLMACFLFFGLEGGSASPNQIGYTALLACDASFAQSSGCLKSGVS